MGLDAILQSEGVPKCSCGGRIKPDVVLYEEGLDEENIEEAVRLIREADILIVGGTSLGVYPAAGLIDYYRGHKLVLINKSETPYDNRADLLIHDALGEVFSKLDKQECIWIIRLEILYNSKKNTPAEAVNGKFYA